MIDPLFVDVYAGDLSGKPNWSLLASLGAPWHGAIIKTTEGLGYSPTWFDVQWKAIAAAAPERLGFTWFRGAYHFLKFNADGRAQADYYLAAIERAGGWGKGDLLPVVDVELGGESNSNQHASGSAIVDCATAFAERVREVTGRKVVLYGNGAMRDRGITNHMGCDYLWPARYTSSLPPFVYERIGWTTPELLLWQYGGDGVAYLSGYPTSPPGFGACDVSVLVMPGGLEALRGAIS